MFLSGAEGLNWVTGKLADEGNATLAVAFWGAGAIHALGLERRRREGGEVKIICNLSMGGTNPSEVRALMGLERVTVLQCDRLHGKVYLFGDAAMVGSSNVSANGLSFEGSTTLGWDEANIVITDRKCLDDVSAWVAALKTRSIRERDLIEAEEAWRMRRQARPAMSGGLSIVDLLVLGRAALAGEDVYLNLTMGDFTSEAQSTVAEAQRDQPSIDAWEDWVSLPQSGTFLSFATKDGGTFKFEGCFWRTPKVPDRPAREGKQSLQWCFKQRDLPLGLGNPRLDKANWRDVIAAAVADRGSVEEDGAHFIRFDDLADIWADAQLP